MKQEKRIVVRGGGDLATGTIHRLWSAGLRVLVLEAEHPAAIRRQVSLCEAVYEGETTVEGLRAVRVASLAEADAVWAQNAVPVWWTRRAAAWLRQSLPCWWMPSLPRKISEPRGIWLR